MYWTKSAWQFLINATWHSKLENPLLIGINITFPRLDIDMHICEGISDRTATVPDNKQANFMYIFTDRSAKRHCLCNSTVTAVISGPRSLSQVYTYLLQKWATRHLKVKKPALSNSNKSSTLNFQAKLPPLILRLKKIKYSCHYTH